MVDDVEFMSLVAVVEYVVRVVADVEFGRLMMMYSILSDWLMILSLL